MSALRMRRGTRAAVRRKQRDRMRTLMFGALLVCVGIFSGIIIGYAFISTSGSPPVSPATASGSTSGAGEQVGVAALLRGKQHVVGERIKQAEQNLMKRFHRDEAKPPISDVARAGLRARVQVGSTSPVRSKADFMKHVPQLGGKGPTPYIGPIVEENHDFSTFHAEGGDRFIEYKHGDSPYDYGPTDSDQVARSRLVHVKNAMKFAYGNYEKYAFGKDELLPQTQGSSNNWGGMATTMVDSLDTLWLMGMKDEFWRARDYIKEHLNHDQSADVSVFETTIRSLGGLLAAYDWSGDEVFLKSAEDLGARLFRAFDSASGIPKGRVNLRSGLTSNLSWTAHNAVTAEAGTLQLEFRMLARLTGKREYKDKSERVYHILKDIGNPNGLYPNMLRNDRDKAVFSNAKLTFGAMGDSLYEYFLKVWVQGGMTEPFFREMYDQSIQGMFDELLSTSTPSQLVFIADKNSGRIDTKMDHLVCFMGGLLALGAYTDPLGLESERAQRDLKTAKALTYTCYQMYARMPTGISPEFVQFYPGKDFEAGPGAPHYLLRPETAESFFILYQLTKDPVYREWGWEVFQAIEKYCKANAGYGSLRDVRNVNIRPDNKMESFFLAETLKYIYLLLDPDTEVDVLNKHVFNTEAHPVRNFKQMDADGVVDKLK